MWERLRAEPDGITGTIRRILMAYFQAKDNETET
jgi:hypothetical protein